MRMRLRKNRGVRLLIAVVASLVLIAAWTLSVNYYVVKVTEDRILTAAEAKGLEADCILVLGAGVRSDGKPTDLLEDRIQRGIELYEQGTAGALLMSGDHGQVDYDEVNAMKSYASESGISTTDIFMDHAGFSTYESMYRARDVFQARKVVIVSQEYHLYRAIYIAERLGLDAYGVSADQHTFPGQWRRDFREILARNKDFLTVIVKPEPKYLGDAIPVSGNGDTTNDKK